MLATPSPRYGIEVSNYRFSFVTLSVMSVTNTITIYDDNEVNDNAFYMATLSGRIVSNTIAIK